MALYKYWTAFESEEHFLYSHEVAQIWQVYSCNAPSPRINLNSIFIGELLKESCQELGKQPTYYETRNGLKRVFDHETIEFALSKLKERVEIDGHILYCKANGKRYRFVIGEENILPATMQQFPNYYEEDGTPIDPTDNKRFLERKEELKRKKAKKS